MPINEYGMKADTPTPPTNEDVGRSCVSVSLPTGGRGSPCDHYPWYIGFIMQGSTPAPTPSPGAVSTGDLLKLLHLWCWHLVVGYWSTSGGQPGGTHPLLKCFLVDFCLYRGKHQCNRCGSKYTDYMVYLEHMTRQVSSGCYSHWKNLDDMVERFVCKKQKYTYI